VRTRASSVTSLCGAYVDRSPDGCRRPRCGRRPRPIVAVRVPRCRPPRRSRAVPVGQVVIAGANARPPGAGQELVARVASALQDAIAESSHRVLVGDAAGEAELVAVDAAPNAHLAVLGAHRRSTLGTEPAGNRETLAGIPSAAQRRLQAVERRERTIREFLADPADPNNANGRRTTRAPAAVISTASRPSELTTPASRVRPADRAPTRSRVRPSCGKDRGGPTRARSATPGTRAERRPSSPDLEGRARERALHPEPCGRRRRSSSAASPRAPGPGVPEIPARRIERGPRPRRPGREMRQKPLPVHSRGTLRRRRMRGPAGSVPRTL
jgi:hypothetical protein